MTILVTGAAGFIGSHVTQTLLGARRARDRPGQSERLLRARAQTRQPGRDRRSRLHFDSSRATFAMAQRSARCLPPSGPAPSFTSRRCRAFPTR